MPSSPSTETLDVGALRAHYPALDNRVDGKRLVYLDSACTALKPRCVAERLGEFYLNWGGCGGKRSTHLLSQRVEEWFQDARRETADFLGAERAEEIVFTSGTTEAVNLVARAFPFEGDRREVVLTDMEHNSVLLPLLELEKRGEASLKFCPVKGGQLDLEAMERLITRRTALVAVARSSNVLGGLFPVARVARMARSRGARILVDDAQYLSSHREDVRETDADFVAFSSHKLGGPFGVGVLYGKENLLNRLGVYKVGGGTVKDVSWNGSGAEAVYLDAPMRFEAGVQDLAGVAAFGDALRFFRAIPERALRAHIAGLVRRTAEGVARFEEVGLLGEIEDLERGSIVSFAPRHPGFSIADFNLYLNHELDGRFIAVRAGEHCAHLLHHKLGVPGTVRVSFFAYNTLEEADLFLDALGGYIREACR
ncbi:MAG: aminotransferase class V-fold PLP-dependent enzyme [Elusimicrobiota bacterium]